MYSKCAPIICVFALNSFHSGLSQMGKKLFLDCQKLNFSAHLSRNRIDHACQTFGSIVVQRLLCFALYLLGVNRSAIGELLKIPPETAKSIIKSVKRNGLSALEDRRRRSSNFLPKAKPDPPVVTLRENEERIALDFGDGGRILQLSRQDPLQLKIVLLSMFNSKILTKPQVAKAIALTPSHTATLAQRLREKGARALIDSRHGQKKEYRVPPSVKGELVQQFAVDIITSGKTSGEKISNELKERCNILLPARTVRHHLAQMGLGKIKRSLPQLLVALKKTSDNCSST